jgi:hypothetical protein
MRKRRKINIELVCQWLVIAVAIGMMVTWNSQNNGVPIFQTVLDITLGTLFVVIGLGIIIALIALIKHVVDRYRRKRLKKA